MRSRGIGYVEPPASWADQGQKVRTPGEVLDGRMGTCLDTVVTWPPRWSRRGSARCSGSSTGTRSSGYWRAESSLANAAELDAAGVVNLVDLGEIGLVETTR